MALATESKTTAMNQFTAWLVLTFVNEAIPFESLIRARAGGLVPDTQMRMRCSFVPPTCS